MGTTTPDLSPAQGERLVPSELANKAGREGKEFPGRRAKRLLPTRCAACPNACGLSGAIPRRHWDGVCRARVRRPED